MTDTDTRAALDAAIDDWRRLRGLTYLTGGAQAAQAARDRVDRAITAHVEAEVARRLAAAPGVEEAIEMLGDTCYERGHVHAGGLPDDSVRSIDRDAAEATLRAAIAADRERAVEAGSLTALDEFRKLLPKYVMPDEARRLVGEFAGAHGAMVAHLAGMTGPESGEDVAARTESARAALLRALGVEA